VGIQSTNTVDIIYVTGIRREKERETHTEEEERERERQKKREKENTVHMAPTTLFFEELVR